MNLRPRGAGFLFWVWSPRGWRPCPYHHLLVVNSVLSGVFPGFSRVARGNFEPSHPLRWGEGSRFNRRSTGWTPLFRIPRLGPRPNSPPPIFATNAFRMDNKLAGLDKLQTMIRGADAIIE